MNCKVCGSSEFVTNDGITYCTECQSQIEATQTEVAVEHVLSRDIGSSGPKKTVTEKGKEYSDWITAECFNHVLYMQVSALINLGASLKLKTTVLHIWSKYLQRCEIAFRIDYLAKSEKPLLGPLPTKRDLTVLYGNKLKSKRKREKSETSDPEKSVENIQGSEVESEVDSDVSEIPVVKCDKKKYSSHARKLLRKTSTVKQAKRYGMLRKKVFNMTLSKTLSICYLGLLYTEDQLTLCDLIRLVYEEKVPFLNLIDKLPSNMKLEMGDRSTFQTYHVPDAYIILKTSREIAQFTKLPKFKEPSVFVAASRLVKDLNLPGDILPVVKTLVEKYAEQLSNYKSPPKLENIPHEYQALASILVALKLFFILDDKFEIEHSKVMNKLNAVCPDHNFFEWKEWQKQSVIKEYLFLCEKPGYSTVNRVDGLSADIIISKYPFAHLKLPLSEDNESSPLRDTAVKNDLSNVLSNIISIPQSTPSVPTSFSLRRAVKCFMEEWQGLSMFKETREIDFTLLKRDFSSSSLSFNPTQFNEGDDELSYLLMTTLYIPEISVNLGYKNSYPFTYHHQIIKATSKYWFINPEKSGTTDLTSDWFDKLPDSFKWLVNFVAKYVYCNNIVLYKEIARIEKILFLQKQRIKNLARCNNKFNVDF